MTVIVFECPVTPNHKNEEVLTFKLQSNLASKASATYDLTVPPYFKSSSSKELFKFLKNTEKDIASQSAQAPSAKYTLKYRLLQTDALAYFSQSAITHTGEMSETSSYVLMNLLCMSFCNML